MFVGNKAKILAGFQVEDPRLIPEKRMRRHPAAPAPARGQRRPGEVAPGMRAMDRRRPGRTEARRELPDGRPHFRGR